jgi:hypothetical protein
MSKSNVLENGLLLLLFNGTALSGLALNDPAITNLWIAAHTADPGEAGGQSTNEATYGSYARVGVARTVAGWTVVSNVVTNTADITFPQCTSGNNTITHLSIGTDQTGIGRILYLEAVTTPLEVTVGIQPRFLAGDLEVEEE